MLHDLLLKDFLKERAATVTDKHAYITHIQI